VRACTDGCAHTHTRQATGLSVLDDVAATSTSFYDLRAMRQTARFTLALYTRRRYALVTSSGRVGCAVSKLPRKGISRPREGGTGGGGGKAEGEKAKNEGRGGRMGG